MAANVWTCVPSSSLPLFVFHVKHGTRVAPKVGSRWPGTAATWPLWAASLTGEQGGALVLWSGCLPGVCGAGRRAAVVAVPVVAPRPWLAVYGRCWIWCQPQAGWTQGTRSGESRCRGTGCHLFPVSSLPCVRVWSGARRTHDGSTALRALALPPLLLA
jgi:hypothetical protein